MVRYPPYSGERIGDIGKRRGATSAGFAFTEISKDKGCPDIADSCLSCPLPACLWEYGREERAAVKARFLEWKHRQG
jgi:hypothetical protein